MTPYHASLRDRERRNDLAALAAAKEMEARLVKRRKIISRAYDSHTVIASKKKTIDDFEKRLRHSDPYNELTFKYKYKKKYLNQQDNGSDNNTESLG